MLWPPLKPLPVPGPFLLTRRNHIANQRRPTMLKLRRKHFVRNCLLLAALAVAPAILQAQDWPQWALNPQHTLFDSNVVGQPPNRILVSLFYNFTAATE